MNMRHDIAVKYGVDKQRGLQLFCELAFYLYQRCRCGRCRKHFDDNLVLDVIIMHWPGSPIEVNEAMYIGQVLGAIMSDLKGAEICLWMDNIGIDWGMGADWCLQKLYTGCKEAADQVEAELKQNSRHN